MVVKIERIAPYINFVGCDAALSRPTVITEISVKIAKPQQRALPPHQNNTPSITSLIQLYIL